MFNAVECLKPFHKIKDFLELPAPDEYNQEDRSYDLEGIKILANDVRFRHPFDPEEIYYQHLVKNKKSIIEKNNISFEVKYVSAKNKN